MMDLLWKSVWQFLRKLNIELSYDPAVPLLDIEKQSWKELKIESQTDTYLPVFIEESIHNSQRWK